MTDGEKKYRLAYAAKLEALRVRDFARLQQEEEYMSKIRSSYRISHEDARRIQNEVEGKTMNANPRATSLEEALAKQGVKGKDYRVWMEGFWCDGSFYPQGVWFFENQLSRPRVGPFPSAGLAKKYLLSSQKETDKYLRRTGVLKTKTNHMNANPSTNVSEKDLEKVGHLVRWLTEATEATITFRVHYTESTQTFIAEILYFNDASSRGVIGRGWEKTASAAVKSMLKEAPSTKQALIKLAESVRLGSRSLFRGNPNEPVSEMVSDSTGVGILAVGVLALIGGVIYVATRPDAPGNDLPAPGKATPTKTKCLDCAASTTGNLTEAESFAEASGYTLWCVENQSVTTWKPPKPAFASDPKARAYSELDCSFYTWSAGAWVKDDIMNGELFAWRSKFIGTSGHPVYSFVIGA